ncbi:MAG: beta-ketoacyl-[acyl-carrier-protein] synthase family protein [bacterium]
MREKVILSGLGVLTAAGDDIASSLVTFQEGVRLSVVSRSLEGLEQVFPMFAVQRKDIPEVDRTYHLALRATRQALMDAGLDQRPLGFRLGICVGTTVACQLNDIPFYRSYRETGHPPLAPVHRFIAGSLAKRLAEAVGAEGPVMTVVNACSSGTDAAGVACSWLNANLCDAVIVGGADELSKIPSSGFWSLSVMSPEFCKPFDRDRQGLNLGEGAGIAIFERQASAIQRGQLPILEVAGFGAAADGYHLTAPHPEGLGIELAIRAALTDAGIVPEQIDFVNAHGTATRENDRIEGNALARVFGSAVRVVSTKGYTGHTLGAAGGVELVFAALALREGWIPANIGFENQDEQIPFSPLTAVTSLVRDYAISTSLAFGGNNAAVVLRRVKEGV